MSPPDPPRSEDFTHSSYSGERMYLQSCGPDFGRLYEEILASRLSLAAKVLYAFLDYYVTCESRLGFPTYDEIAEHIHMRPEVAMVAMNELKELGWLVKFHERADAWTLRCPHDKEDYMEQYLPIRIIGPDDDID